MRNTDPAARVLNSRTRSRRAAAALVLAAAAVAAGCRTSPIYVPAVQMNLAAQPTEVRAGDTVRIGVTLRNPGQDTVLLEFAGECRVTYMLLDSASRAVHGDNDAARCMVPGGRRLVLAPGDSVQLRGEWPGTHDRGGPVAPGAYIIGAVLGDHDSTVRGEKKYKMTSGANRVPIRVLPAGP